MPAQNYNNPMLHSNLNQSQSRDTQVTDQRVLLPEDKVDLNSGTQNTTDFKPKKWLIMNYIAGDCSLVEDQLKNVDQMELAGSDANTHIIALVDVGPKTAPLPLGKEMPKEESSQSQKETAPPGSTATVEQPQPGDWKGAKTLYIVKDQEVGRLNSKVTEDHGIKFDMSNPENLKEFIVDSVKKYPAQNVALILNDHGGGFTGAMEDKSDGNFMSVPQIKKALTEAQKETGKKIDIIGFDACLMAEAEVADALKDVGHYLLASEENEGGPGWDYKEILGGKNLTEAIQQTQLRLNSNEDVTPEEFAKTIIDINKQHSVDIPTFSAVDLTKMNTVKKATDELAKAKPQYI